MSKQKHYEIKLKIYENVIEFAVLTISSRHEDYTYMWLLYAMILNWRRLIFHLKEDASWR